MTEEEYKKEIKKVSATRNHNIKNSVGISDFINAHTKDLNFTPTQARAILKRLNELIADALASGLEIKLPAQMGSLEIRQFTTYVRLLNGKVKTNRSIDWNRTLELWYNDAEARKNKTLLRTENKEVYRIFYNRGRAKYNNKVFYEFIANRTLKEKIKKNIKEGIIKDAFKQYG